MQMDATQHATLMYWDKVPGDIIQPSQLQRTLSKLGLQGASPTDTRYKGLRTVTSLLIGRLALTGVIDLTTLCGARGVHIWAMAPTVST
jgi:hypothetical protein